MIIKNISFGLLSSISRLILGLATFTLLTRFLNIEDFGKYSYLLTITGYLTIIIDFGFNFSSLNNLPKDKLSLKNNFYETIFSKLLLTILSLIVMVILLIIIPYFNYSLEFLIFSSIAILFSFSTYISQVFKAFNRFEVEFMFVLINNLLPLILFVFIGEGISLLDIAYGLLLFRVLGVFYLVLKFRNFFSDKKIVRKLEFGLGRIKNNWKYAVHMIIGSVFISSDIIIMKETLGLSQIAIYSTGIKILMSLLMIGEVVNSSFIPKLSECYSNSELLFKRNAKKLFIIILFLSFAFSISVYLMGEFVIGLVFGEKYDELIPLLPYFSVLLIIRFMAIFFGTMVTLAEKQKYRAYTVLIILPIHLLLNKYLQIEMGIIGALIAMIISFSIITTINLLLTIKYHGKVI